MFKEKTVIVLGAGASMPYNFPSGAGLVDEFLSGNVDPLASLLNKLTSMQDMEEAQHILTKVIEALYEAHPPSIDLWLRNRQEFSEIGKFGIAYHLIGREKPSVLMNRMREGREKFWYADFLNTLGTTPSEVTESRGNLSIVTFNYDRSLSEFAFRKFRSFFGVSERESAELVASLDIRHVYGRLGCLPWEFRGTAEIPDTDFVLPYNGQRSAQACSGAANRIQLIHEVDRESEHVKHIRSRIREADSIFMIGFGFHDENCDLLELDKTEAAIYATSIGLFEPRKEEAMQRLRNLEWCEGDAAYMVRHFKPFAQVANGKGSRKAKRNEPGLITG